MENCTLDYFIEKFTAIPKENWGRNKLVQTTYEGVIQKCVLGHCGMTIYVPNEEAQAFLKVIGANPKDVMPAIRLNDYATCHPKDAVLQKLQHIKAWRIQNNTQ